MSTAELLHELEPLTHDARIRRMVELGRPRRMTRPSPRRWRPGTVAAPSSGCSSCTPATAAATTPSRPARRPTPRALFAAARYGRSPLRRRRAGPRAAPRSGRPRERLAMCDACAAGGMRRRTPCWTSLAAHEDDVPGLLLGYGSAAAVARHFEVRRGLEVTSSGAGYRGSTPTWRPGPCANGPSPWGRPTIGCSTRRTRPSRTSPNCAARRVAAARDRAGSALSARPDLPRPALPQATRRGRRPAPRLGGHGQPGPRPRRVTDDWRGSWLASTPARRPGGPDPSRGFPPAS